MSIFPSPRKKSRLSITVANPPGGADGNVDIVRARSNPRRMTPKGRLPPTILIGAIARSLPSKNSH